MKRRKSQSVGALRFTKKCSLLLLSALLLLGMVACGNKAPAIKEKDESTGVEISAEQGVFQKGTEISIKYVSNKSETGELVKKALDGTSGRFVVFDISAMNVSEAVQPDGTVKVTFPIPAGYSKDVAVFYVGEDGKCEKLDTVRSEDGTSAEATLSHFSIYVLADLAVKHAADAGGNDSTEAVVVSEETVTDPVKPGNDGNTAKDNKGGEQSSSANGSGTAESTPASTKPSGGSSGSSSGGTGSSTGTKPGTKPDPQPTVKDEWVYDEHATSVVYKATVGGQDNDTTMLMTPEHKALLDSYTKQYFDSSISKSELIDKLNSADVPYIDAGDPSYLGYGQGEWSFVDDAFVRDFTFSCDGTDSGIVKAYWDNVPDIHSNYYQVKVMYNAYKNQYHVCEVSARIHV